MPEIITPGRWRGLKTTSNANHVFAILAFDQRGNYRRMLPDDTPFETAVQIKREVVAALSPLVTGVLLDPVYGVPAALDMPGGSGILLALEKTGYAGDPTERRVDFIDGWTVAKIKQFGASAVKLLVYYHPDAKSAGEIETVVQNVAEACHRHDIPLFVEPLSYSLDAAVPEKSEAFARLRPEIVRRTVENLGGTGVDVLKIEFPVNVQYDTDHESWRAACTAVNDAARVPWVLLSAGVEFETFKQQVAVACQCGASGFLGGRAIWKEAITMSPGERQHFLATTAAARIRELTAIVNMHARPWTAFYEPIAIDENWYHTYP